MLNPHQGPRVQSANDSTGLSVLIVDDNRDAAESLADLLTIYGYDTRTAFDSEAARTSAPTDVVILEPRLRDTDGWELTRQMRERPGTKKPLFLAVTTCTSRDDRSRSAEVGFHHHLVKPVDPTALVEILNRFARTLLPRHQPSTRIDDDSDAHRSLVTARA